MRPEEVARACQDAVRRAESALQAVATMPEEARSFGNTPEAIENALQDLEDAAAPAVLLKYVSVSSAARDAGAGCESKVDAFSEAVFARRDLWLGLSAYAARREPLAGESALLLERELEDFQDAGCEIKPPARNELHLARARLAAQETAFQEHIAWPRESLLFTREELAGLPEAAIDSLPRQGRLFRVAAAPEEYIPFLSAVRDAAARERWEFLYHNRAAITNAPVLQELPILRQKTAEILGRRSYADVMMARHIVGDPDQARVIIRDLGQGLKAAAQEDVSALKDLKRRAAGPRKDIFLRPWDRVFYLARWRQSLHPRVAEQAIAEYFPIETVTQGALAVAEKFLDLRLRRVPGAEAWHPDVALYEARSADDDAVLGYFYLDLMARPGKLARPAVFVLARGLRRPDGSFRPPVCVLSAALPRPADAGPVLLRHAAPSDVEDVFQGLGQVMGVILPRSRYGRFSGADLSPELREAFSFLFIRLAWRPEVVAMISGHYQDSARRLPPGLLAAAAGARAAGCALAALDELALALTDLEMRWRGDAQPGAIYRKNFALFASDPVTPRTYPEASALGLAGAGGGVAAEILARVVAENLWRRAGEEGLFEPAAGRHRREILFASPAGREAQALQRYLGRGLDFKAMPSPVLWPAWPGCETHDQASSGPRMRRRLLY